MFKKLAAARGKIPTMFIIAGAGLVVWGVGMIYFPLGPIFGGLALMLEGLTAADERGES